MYPGHNWILKFRKVVGNMRCVEKEFKQTGPVRFITPSLRLLSYLAIHLSLPRLAYISACSICFYPFLVVCGGPVLSQQWRRTGRSHTTQVTPMQISA